MSSRSPLARAVPPRESRRDLASPPIPGAPFEFSGNGHAEGFTAAVTYPAGTELFRECDEPEAAFYVERGLVKLQRLHPMGESLIVGLRSTGWILAAASVLLERPFAVTAVTVTPCRIARMDAVAFRERARAGGALSWSLHRMHCEELQSQLGLVSDLYAMPARERLERFLWKVAGALGPAPNPRELRFECPLRHWEIAQSIGVSPPYLSQLFSELEGQGAIRRDKGSIYIRR